MISGSSISNTYGVDPQLLRTFVTVVRLKSFSAAARELRYTQSAVSQQIAALEEQLGAVLLGRRPVTPTEAGERLLAHAGPILLRLDAARADVARAAGDPPRRLVFGASALALTAAVAAGLGQLRRRAPRLDLRVRVTRRESVATQIATGELELGLTDGVAAPLDPLRLADAGVLTAIGVDERSLVVVLPAGHPLARRPGLRLGDLTDARWLDAPEVAAPLPALRAAAVDGLRAPVRYEGTDVGALLALVGAGHGLAVLPDGLPLPARVVAVPLVAPRLVHRVELLHGHLATDAARWLATHLATDPG